MFKKLLAFSLAVLMICSLAACGKDGSKESNSENGYIVKGSQEDEVVELGKVDSPLNPQTVYDKLTYTPQMFYGTYRVFGGKEAEKKYADEMEYVDYVVGDKTSLITSIPFEIKAGHNTWNHMVNHIEEYDWMEVYFYKKSNAEAEANLDFMICAYTVEGNKLTLKPLKTFNYDEDSKKITYEFSEIVWEYEFAFSGRNLTLSKNGKSVTMMTGLDAYGEETYIYAEGYLSPDSAALDNIDQFEFRYESAKDNRFFVESVSGESLWTAIGKIEENGLFTFTAPWKDGTKTYQYVYFMCDNDGLILTDGTNTYYYNDSYSDRNRNTINTFLTEDQTGKLDELTEQELEAIVEKKENLMDDLAKAFNDAGIKVTVDEQSGELRMDSSVLFGGDSAVLTSEGKAFLNKFVNAYTSIVFSDKYDGFVSKTMVEGHTAPVAGGTYESGLPLSEQRANNVKDYCVSSETGVDTTKLASSLEAVGYSNSKPVKDANGNVDMAASRRVSFKFIINLDK